MYNNLIRLNPGDGLRTIVPELATSWEISPDTLTFAFRLRDGVKFQDGTPFSSEDVVATFERIITPPQGITSIFKSNFDATQKVEAIDRLTARFVLKEPRVWMFSWFVFPGVAIYSKKSLTENNNDLRKVGNPPVPGTGPFLFKEHKAAERWVFERNPNYWNREVPYLDSLEMLHVPSFPDRGTAVLTGQADFSWNVAPDVWEEGRKRKDIVSTSTAPSFGGQILYINSKRPPYTDARVRRAIWLAINRHDAVKVGRKGGSWYDVGGWIHPQGEGTLAEAELSKRPGYRVDNAADIAEAKKLLSDAGFPDGKGFHVVDIGTPSVPLFSQALAPFVADQLKRNLSIESKIRVYERALESVELKKEFDMIMGTLGGRPPTPDHTSLWLVNWVTGGSVNWGKYSNPELDKVVQELSRTLDPVKRAELFRKGQELMDAAPPAANVWWISHQLMWRNYVKGLSLDKRVVVEWGRLETAWLDK
jgi:peptide/nickel transport system substrate-binding protein